ncbi:hypothetical protein BV25DRAFT_1872264 [Artomyces pyxidatus]|uniref:Uncharacterized protein n=1 Tax=Artomyces pyxidatus TaxID=48021 RepID=A0ACB8SPU0_9AGAM|nr:hypothetical protein BV25DRAFT_1872264 [Artomyces pyxidatus]
MDRRRGVSKRPASTEEVECWSHATTSLSALSNLSVNSATQDTIGRVNRLILAWPTDETIPAEGIDGVKTVHKKLVSGLNEIKTSSERDVKALDEALERIGVLIALRKASEATPPGIPLPPLPMSDYKNIHTPPEKRVKRPRAHSPAPPPPTPPTPAVAPRPPPTRGSVGPPAPVPFSREPKARREALAKQLPLECGRMVAFHPSPNGKGGDSASGDAEDTTWIMAKITRCIGMDKNRYEVQDVEPQEDGQPGAKFNTTLRAIIPLPDLEAPPTSAAHLNAYQEFPTGSTVLALYPDTSCFYRAEVLASPKDLQPPGRVVPKYKLKFEDDDDQEHTVSAQWVVEWPGQ